MAMSALGVVDPEGEMARVREEGTAGIGGCEPKALRLLITNG